MQPIRAAGVAEGPGGLGQGCRGGRRVCVGLCSQNVWLMKVDRASGECLGAVCR